MVLGKILNAIRGGENAAPVWNPWDPLVAADPAAWEAALAAARGGKRVLVAPGAGGFHLGVLVESSLAAALTLRGAEVDILLCDSVLSGCQMTEIMSAPPEALRGAPPQPRCSKCEKRGRNLFAPLGLRTLWLGELVSPAERAEAERISEAVPLEEVSSYRYRGLAVGEHAAAGALRYFARGDFEGEPHAREILRHYLRSALITVFAVEAALERGKYQVVCFNHGIYVPQGLIGEVCRSRGVQVVNWNPAYRKSSFVFSHGDSYHHTMISEPVSTWEGLEWSSRLERDTLAYLRSRRLGTEDWIWFHHEPVEDTERIAREVGLDTRRPTIALLTNVFWDAQLHYGSNAFRNMLEWVLETIRYFARRPDLNLAIRVHPAELRGGIPSRQLLVPEIARVFPELPENVRVIGPENEISTYGLAELANAVLIYNTKTGIEVSSLGIPVVVAGEAWIRGKGFSLDASTREEYFRILDSFPLDSRLDAPTLLRARKYAYHFFFRRMIPLPFIDQPEKGGKFQVSLSTLDELRPGVWKGLDVITEGVLEGRPFVYPSEMMG